MSQATSSLASPFQASATHFCGWYLCDDFCHSSLSPFVRRSTLFCFFSSTEASELNVSTATRSPKSSLKYLLSCSPDLVELPFPNLYCYHCHSDSATHIQQPLVSLASHVRPTTALQVAQTSLVRNLTMAPPPPAHLPLQQRLMALAQTLQFAWFIGYVHRRLRPLSLWS